ncbi:hypothetical protein [Aureliella helgolandensis]|uniref:GH10 domain-containing protein n=1 Tax=Aureliella helgolandensis TaxID=2527968 RepID=A0A518GES7_9BACT|nr:hypothetical protein [Aureliella helgolandensis]QDV27060.1 hypothetical protein Q31a_54410 [Aureliella helgolandensis]
MGDLHFHTSQAEEFDPRVWNTAYLTGIEGIPWHCHHRLQGEQFSIGREIDESGKLNIVWPTTALGNVCLATTSLRLSPKLYNLGVEVARGTVHQLKNQAYEWQRIGLKFPDGFLPLADQALDYLLQGLTAPAQSKQQHTHAQNAIDQSLQASVALCDTFSTQALDSRRATEGRLATLLGARLQPEVSLTSIGDALNSAFNLVSVPVELGRVELSSGKTDFSHFDQQVEWAANVGKRVCVGPLVNFRKGQLPQWMVLLDAEFEKVLEVSCEHAARCVERYRGKTHVWNCAAGLNVPGDMNWSDEEVLRMAVALIETVRRADERSPVLLTIDQPWSEYLRDEPNGISPLHFADALIRADLGLSGLALDLSFGTEPGLSFPRDPIDISRLVDRWAMLGLPLMIHLSCPTHTPQGPQSSSSTAGWKTPAASSTGAPINFVSPELLTRLLLCKPAVHAVIWDNLSDRVPKAGGASGLWGVDGKAKPLLRNMLDLRRTYLH